MEQKGKLIAFEGCDRAGKSTQIKLLNEYLNGQGINAVKMAFPDYSTQIGQIIKEKLKQNCDQTEMHLLFVLNRRELQDKIKYYINNGTTVLLDRYKHSGRAYGFVNGLDENWLIECDKVNIDPDYVFYLDINPEIACGRVDYGKDCIYENIKFQKGVRDYYTALCMVYTNWIVINCQKKSIDNIHKEIVENYLKL